MFPSGFNLICLFPGDSHATRYMFSSMGLFPAPLGRNAKSAVLQKVKSKFKLMGKFMAKAVMDSRMVSSLVSLTWE